MRRRTLRAFSIILIFILLVSAASPLSLAVGSERRVVRVGFFPFDGYHMVDENGYRQGYGYEYLQKMLDYANWEYEYVGYDEGKSWSDMIQLLKDGQIDMLTSATKTAERENDFAYSDEPIGTSSAILTVKAGNTEYSGEDKSNWSGMRVGMIEGNSRNESFAEFASENGFTYVPVYFNSFSDLKQALSNGTVDAEVTSNLRQLSDEWLIAQFDPKPFYVIVRKDDAQLLSEVNYAIKQIHTYFPEFEDTLFKKYYSANESSQIDFTDEERAFIAQCQKDGTVFQAIIDPDRKPYSYVDDGRLKGILTDICSEIFSRTGLTVNIAAEESRSEYLGSEKSGAAQICCDLSSNPARAEESGYVLTSSYYDSTIARVTRRDFTGTAQTVGFVRNSLVYELMAGKVGRGVEVKYFDSIQDCTDAVKHGDVDAAYLFTRTGQSIFYNDETNTLVCVSMPTEAVSFSIGVSKDENYLLASIIDKASASINDEDISKASAPYLQNETKEQTLVGMFYGQPMFAASCIAGLLVLAFLIALTIILRKKQAAEMRSNAALKAAVAEAERASNAKQEFISRISHDIRTPMNAISGMTEFAMQDMGDKEKLTKDLDNIRSSNSYLLSLINDVLDISKIDSGAIELHPEPYPYGEYSESVRNMFEPICRGKGIRLIIECNRCGKVVMADKIRVNQVTLNLLSNAVKYTPAGGTVTFCITTLDRGDKVGAVIEVRDTGIGMSEDFQKIMFEPFSQDLENEARRKMERGSGLGLSIVKRLVDIMGGKLTVNSRIGKGTTVRVDVEFPAAPEAQLDEAEKKPDEEKLQKLSGTVLLAEDNDINAEITARLAKSFGLKTVRAENGAEAVKKFSASAPGEFAAILMDIQMPVMNGYEAMEKIRALPRDDAAAIPIIAMTADAFDEALERCRDAGADAHVSKPVDPRLFRRVLEEHLGK